MLQVLLLLHRTAFASGDEACRDADRAGRSDVAFAACAACASEPGPRAGWCADRADHYAARADADGTFAGWSELEQARRTPDDPSREARVEALVVRDGLSPTTRVEATLWLMDAASRRGDFAGALAASEAVWPPEALATHPSGTAESAVRDRLILRRSEALARLGRVDEARAVEAAVRVPTAPSAARPSPVDAIAMEQRRTLGAYLAGCALLASLVALAPFAWRGQSGAPWGLVPLGVMAGGAWGVAEAWAPGSGASVPWLFAAFAVVHLIAARALGGASRGRAPLRIAAAGATLAACYLTWWWRGELAWLGM